jgi:protein-tyrosine phosphatase
MAASTLVARATALGRTSSFEVASAGVAVDRQAIGADPRAVAATGRRSIALANHRCRQLIPTDFATFDLILAADQSVMEAVDAMAPPDHTARTCLAMDFVAGGKSHDIRDIPDPWSGSAQDYEHALDLIVQVVEGILQAYPATSLSATSL